MDTTYTPLPEAAHHQLSKLTQHYSYRDMLVALGVDARADGAARLANDLFALAQEWERRGLGITADIDYMHDENRCVRCRAPLGASQYTPFGVYMPTFCSFECYMGGSFQAHLEHEGRGMDAQGRTLSDREQENSRADGDYPFGREG